MRMNSKIYPNGWCFEHLTYNPNKTGTDTIYWDQRTVMRGRRQRAPHAFQYTLCIVDALWLHLTHTNPRSCNIEFVSHRRWDVVCISANSNSDIVCVCEFGMCRRKTHQLVGTRCFFDGMATTTFVGYSTTSDSSHHSQAHSKIYGNCPSDTGRRYPVSDTKSVFSSDNSGRVYSQCRLAEYLQNWLNECFFYFEEIQITHFNYCSHIFCSWNSAYQCIRDVGSESHAITVRNRNATILLTLRTQRHIIQPDTLPAQFRQCVRVMFDVYIFGLLDTQGVGQNRIEHQ